MSDEVRIQGTLQTVVLPVNVTRVSIFATVTNCVLRTSQDAGLGNFLELRLRGTLHMIPQGLGNFLELRLRGTLHMIALQAGCAFRSQDPTFVPNVQSFSANILT